jgi:hypothetical protein
VPGLSPIQGPVTWSAVRTAVLQGDQAAVVILRNMVSMADIGSLDQIAQDEQVLLALLEAAAAELDAGPRSLSPSPADSVASDAATAAAVVAANDTQGTASAAPAAAHRDQLELAAPADAATAVLVRGVVHAASSGLATPPTVAGGAAEAAAAAAAAAVTSFVVAAARMELEAPHATAPSTATSSVRASHQQLAPRVASAAAVADSIQPVLATVAAAIQAGYPGCDGVVLVTPSDPATYSLLTLVCAAPQQVAAFGGFMQQLLTLFQCGSVAAVHLLYMVALTQEGQKLLAAAPALLGALAEAVGGGISGPPIVTQWYLAGMLTVLQSPGLVQAVLSQPGVTPSLVKVAHRVLVDPQQQECAAALLRQLSHVPHMLRFWVQQDVHMASLVVLTGLPVLADGPVPAASGAAGMPHGMHTATSSFPADGHANGPGVVLAAGGGGGRGGDSVCSVTALLHLLETQPTAAQQLLSDAELVAALACAALEHSQLEEEAPWVWVLQWVLQAEAGRAAIVSHTGTLTLLLTVLAELQAAAAVGHGTAGRSADSVAGSAGSDPLAAGPSPEVGEGSSARDGASIPAVGGSQAAPAGLPMPAEPAAEEVLLAAVPCCRYCRQLVL